MFTTAGSTLLTIAANELEEGMGSGTVSAVADVPGNAKLFIAETRPETTDPIRIPTASVNATNTEASTLRWRAQFNNSLTCSPMSFSPLSLAPQPCSQRATVLQRPPLAPEPLGDPVAPLPHKYTTSTPMRL